MSRKSRKIPRAIDRTVAPVIVKPRRSLTGWVEDRCVPARGRKRPSKTVTATGLVTETQQMHNITHGVRVAWEVVYVFIGEMLQCVQREAFSKTVELVNVFTWLKGRQPATSIT